jgi:hypothetical protein
VAGQGRLHGQWGHALLDVEAREPAAISCSAARLPQRYEHGLVVVFGR